MRRSGEPLTWIVAGDPDQRTGGYIYDARVVEALRRRNWTVHVTGLEGRFPLADDRARASMEYALADTPAGERVVIDGLAMGGVPEIVRRHSARLDITALVHHPLADETGLPQRVRSLLHRQESEALAAARRVIVTSSFTRGRLQDLQVPPTRVHIVEPGVDLNPETARAPTGQDSRPQRLLCVGTVTPRKGHLALIDALAQLRDRDWNCLCVGSTTRDPNHADAVIAATERLGLSDRIEWLGEVPDDSLAAAYGRADVLVVPSLYEGYGMVVTEALAHGLPVIATDGGALAQTLPIGAGLQVPVGNASALGMALARWCDEPGLRQTLRAGAAGARRGLVDWSQAAAAFERALTWDGTARSARTLP